MTDYIPLEPTRDTDHHEQQKLAKKIKNFIYDPSDIIGSGFSSKVYKGINQVTNEQVAIKVIELSKIQNQVEKYLLNNQINALRALNHKNILKTIDILMTKNNVYIVTEFCQFGDLQQMIKNNKKLQQKDALNIVKDVVQGYIAIEQKNIIHRDLKTANIFLTKSGAKIADFGFCQFMGEKKPQIAYNVGSPAYMSPESYKQNFYSNKSDIWGIGIILYEMLIGQTPQKNLTYTQMSNNLMYGKINCGSNDQIKQILITCFKRDLKQRVDARSLLQMINNVIQKYTFSRQQGRNSKLPNYDSRFTKQAPMTPTQHHRVIGGSQAQVQNGKGSNDNKRFVSYSPSKLNNPVFKNQFQNSTKQLSILQPINNDPGSRTLTSKKQVLSNSGFIQSFNPIKPMDLNEQIKSIKSSIAVLQFIFRLFKYLNQVSIPTLSFLKLFTFRHRSYIDQITENILQQNKGQLKGSEIYKQFQFLKMKFDQAYLQRENSSNLEANHQLMNTMNKLANLPFVDSQSIKAYKQLLKKGCLEIQSQIQENRSNAFVLWDYLMMQYQFLCLYGQGYSDSAIVNQKIQLQTILKEQPKNLTKFHIELLKIKSRYLFQTDNLEVFQNKPSNLYPQSFITKFN